MIGSTPFANRPKDGFEGHQRTSCERTADRHNEGFQWFE